MRAQSTGQVVHGALPLFLRQGAARLDEGQFLQWATIDYCRTIVVWHESERPVNIRNGP